MIKIKPATPNKNIIVIDGMLTDDQLDLLKDNHNDLKYGWKSNRKYNEDQGHWNKLIIGDKKDEDANIDYQHHEKFVTSDIYPIWQKIQMVTGGRALSRCYVNAYTYGTDGYVHMDTPRHKNVSKDLHETVLVYCNQEWDANHGGETVYFTEDMSEIVFSSMPKKNRIVVFDASVPHAARSVSRNCKVLRKVLVFKTRRRIIDEKICVNFIKKNFENIIHSKSNFASHLIGTADILKKHSISSDVCAAGLFHAVYGTTYFKHDANISRDIIKELIGDYAENLAYTFGTLENRTDAIINNTPNFNPVIRYQLACIEYANLYEQFPRIGTEATREKIKQLLPIINI